MSIFQKIGDAISNFFKKEIPIVENAFTSASTVVNVLKTFLGSATGQTIEAILEALVPGVATPVINALNIFFKDFGLVAAEVGKPAPQIAADGLNAIGALTGNSKIIALSNVASIIGHTISGVNSGGTTLQQAIVALPLVYNPNLLSDTPPAVNPILPAANQVSDAQLATEQAEIKAQPGDTAFVAPV